MKKLSSAILAIIFCLSIATCEKATIFTINQSSLSFEEKGGSQKLSFIANKEWTATSSQTWCQVSPATGDAIDNNSISLSITCDANKTYDKRSCTITITCQEYSSTVSVNQETNYAILVNQKNHEVSCNAQSISIEVNTNVKLHIIVDDACKDWLIYNTTKTLTMSTVVLDVAKNENTKREGTVYIKQSDGSLEEKVVIKQKSMNIPFSDDKFKDYCVKNFDNDKDGEISLDEALTIKKINVKTDDIKSMGGIEFFANMTELICIGTGHGTGQLSSLEISKNTTLTNLECDFNKITELDVCNNTALLTLHCSSNQLTTLDVSKCTELTELYCTDNQIINLDVTKCTKLNYLSCSKNQISEILDLSQCPSLRQLFCSENPNLKEIWITTEQQYDKNCFSYDNNVSTVIYVDIIQFADSFVKKVCVQKYDANNDRELTYKEAALVTNINANFFGDYKIAVQFFNELQYFTSLTTIGKNAFEGCTSLQSIMLPNSVISIEERAFLYCQNLSNIKLSDNLQSIGKYGIFGTKLSNLNLPSSLVSIGDHGIAGNNLRTITIPENLTNIGYGILRSCNNLESIHSKYSSSDNRCLIINGVLIGFAPYGIETYTFPSNINSIGKSSISGCKGPKSLVIPEGVTEIGRGAFEYSEVPSIFLPSTIKLITEWAFSNYSEIRNLYCAAKEPPILGSYNFQNSNNIIIYVPENSVDLYKGNSSWSFLADKIIGYDF